MMGWLVIGLNAAAGLWALAAHWVLALRGRLLWIFTAAAQTLLIVQVILGVIHMNRSEIQVSGLHQAYGFVSIFSIAIIYSYRQQIARWTYFLYGFGGLFIMGLGLRAALLS